MVVNALWKMFAVTVTQSKYEEWSCKSEVAYGVVYDPSSGVEVVVDEM